MKLGDFLQSINQTKVNLIRTSDSQQQAEKLYPAFAVNRSLSYQYDCVLLVNELNTRGLRQHGLDNKMQYEFMLHLLDTKKRFSKWEKPQKDSRVELIMEIFNYSHEKAKEVVSLMTEEDLIKLQESRKKGGR